MSKPPPPHTIGLLFCALWLVLYLLLLALALAVDPHPESWPALRVPAAGIAALILALVALDLLAGLAGRDN